MAVETPISRRRSCTDIPCLIVFVGFLVGWVVVAGIAMSQGSIKRFTKPSDSNGSICGVDKDYKKKPNLLFFDLTKCAYPMAAIFGCPTPQICVEKCPDSDFYGAVPQLLTNAKLDSRIETKLKAGLRYCLPEVNRTQLSYARLVDGYHCAPWYVSSAPVAGRCLPANIAQSVSHLQQLSQGLHENLAGTQAQFIGQPNQQIRLMMAQRAKGTGGTNDTTTTTTGPAAEGADGTNTILPGNLTLPGKPETSDGDTISKRVMRVASEALSQVRFVVVHLAGLTCTSLVTSLVLALLFLLLLRCFVGPIVALVVAGMLAALACLTAFCGHQYSALAAATNATESDVNDSDASLVEKPGFWLVSTIVAGCVLLLFLVLVIALRKRIVLAVVLLQQCSAAVGDMLTLMLVPFVSFALQLSVCLLFVFVLLFLLGSSHEWRVTGECVGCERYAEGDRCYPADFDARCGKRCPDAACSSTQNLALYAYNGFALVWSICFVTALNQIAVAIAFSSWYFSNNKRLSIAVPMVAYIQALLYHSGTAAFGSLLIAIVKVIRAVLLFVKKRVEKRGGWPARCASTCCLCCCWCIENVMRFINKRAYIVTALESVGLCTAGRRGVEMVARNLARVAVADSVTALILWLGKVLMVTASVLLCHWVMTSAAGEPVPWALPALFTAIVAYVVTDMTFSVYAMGVDTIFYCAMVDLDVNDGSAAQPYAMSKSLAKALGVTNAPPAEAQPPPPVPPPAKAQPPPPAPQAAGRADSDFWLQSTPAPTSGQFQHPGQVQQPGTHGTAPPGIPKGRH